MAWNEPENNSGKDKDPWRPNQQDGGRQDKGPPDLDVVLNNISKKFNELFGRKSGGNRGRGNSYSPQVGGPGVLFVVFILFAIWGLSGFYSVAEAERAVITRFGKYFEIKDPGLNWSPRFIDQWIIVNIEEIKTHDTEGLMLTKDENVVSVKVNVQYRIEDPKKYLFNVANADKSLAQVTDAALRASIGDSTMDEVLTTGREQITIRTHAEIERIMKPYDMGIMIVGNVNLQETRPPKEVQPAFDDAFSAQEDEVKSQRQAEAYEKDIIPRAKGDATRIMKEAEGYAIQVLNQAEGNIAQFNKLLPEYQLAPEVTKERLYLETMEQVYKNTSKVLVDTKSNGNLLYLPLDKLMNGANSNQSSSASGDSRMQIPLIPTQNSNTSSNNASSNNTLNINSSSSYGRTAERVGRVN